MGLWSGVCCCFGGCIPNLLQLLSDPTCLISQITFPSQCPWSRQVQHTHPLPCRSSHHRQGGMAQLQSVAFPSQTAELSLGSALLSLSSRVHDRTNDDSLSQTSNRSPTLLHQPRCSCPGSKSASLRGLGGDPLLSCCRHDG